MNMILKSDSYKYSHHKQLPPGAEYISSYGEARGSGDADFTFTLTAGIQGFIREYLLNPITWYDIQEADEVITAHGYEFNREGWMHILREHGGYLPLEITALPEGTIVPLSIPLFQIRNTDPKVPWLTSFVETPLLRGVWYPTTVATNSMIIRNYLKAYAEKSMMEPNVDFKLHDFGARGVSSGESAAIGGAAHLMTGALGTDTVESLLYLRKNYGSEMGGFSIPACYDDKTFILSESGWVLFKDLQNQKVAQYNEDGIVTFVNYTNYVADTYVGDMYRFTTQSTTAAIDLLVTPNHRMVRKSITTSKLEVQVAEKATFSHRNRWLQGGITKEFKDIFTDLEKLRVAFQADGSFPSNKEKYTGERSGKIPVRFTLKKERKVARLKEILNNLNLEYTCTESESRAGYRHFWIKSNETFAKNLNWVKDTLHSATWYQKFINEVSLWDGTAKFNSIIYTSVGYENTNMVQYAAILAGYRASIVEPVDNRDTRQQLYQCNISTKANYRVGTKIVKSVEKYNGKVYCVSVGSGMLVVRRNGYVSISGNSEHSTITTWAHEVDAFRNNIKQFDGEGRIFAVVSDSYDIDNAIDNIWGDELYEEVVNLKGTLVIRPDSGDPITEPARIIRKLTKIFGCTKNAKGYWVLPSFVRVLQGDGITKDSVKLILADLEKYALSLDNIALGMGGGMLQLVNRDTLKFAMKANSITINGETRDVYKMPKTDTSKGSKAGMQAVIKKANGEYISIRKDILEDYWEDELQLVYRDGELFNETTLDEIRERANART